MVYCIAVYTSKEIKWKLVIWCVRIIYMYVCEHFFLSTYLAELANHATARFWGGNAFTTILALLTNKRAKKYYFSFFLSLSVQYLIHHLMCRCTSFTFLYAFKSHFHVYQLPWVFVGMRMPTFEVKYTNNVQLLCHRNGFQVPC